MRGQRGVTLVELGTVLAVLAVGIGLVVPALGRAVPALRTRGAADDVYAAVHLTRQRARTTRVMHALVIERDGHAFRIVEDPGGRDRTVVGPAALVDEVVASENTTIRFSPNGYAVPAGTITVRSGGEVRRVVVSLLGRVRVEDGARPR